jgi:hypothetical protein
MRSLLCAAAFVFGAQFGESALPAEATHQEETVEIEAPLLEVARLVGSSKLISSTFISVRR